MLKMVSTKVVPSLLVAGNLIFPPAEAAINRPDRVPAPLTRSPLATLAMGRPMLAHAFTQSSSDRKAPMPSPAKIVGVLTGFAALFGLLIATNRREG